MTAVLPDAGLIEALELAEPGCDFTAVIRWWPWALRRMPLWTVKYRRKCGATPVTHRLVGICGCPSLLCSTHANVLTGVLDALEPMCHVGCEVCAAFSLAADVRVVPL